MHALLLSTLAAWLAPSVGTPQDADRSAPDAQSKAAAALYARECARCHVPPDPDFATDRAWIQQLADTA